MRNDERDVDLLTFTPLAMAVANVVQWLQIRATKDYGHDEHDCRRETNDEQDDKQRRVHRSAHVIDDDDCEDRREKAECENDSDAGRQVITTAPRLKTFACLSV